MANAKQITIDGNAIQLKDSTAVNQVKVGSTAYDPSSGVVSLPAYPTVNNATLTIQKNGTNVQTFTANASANKTANITVPTKTSELTNDSGFITNAGVTGVKGNSESTYRTGNVNITKANIGLGSVGNFKAVSTAASQGLTAAEQTNARTNISASRKLTALKTALNNNTYTVSNPTNYDEIIIKLYLNNGYACSLHLFPSYDYNYGQSDLLGTAACAIPWGTSTFIAYATINTSGLIQITYTNAPSTNPVSGYKVFAR